MTTETGHNWNNSGFGVACLRCGCSFFTLLHEPTERSQQPCPGRAPEKKDFFKRYDEWRWDYEGTPAKTAEPRSEHSE